MKIIVEVCLFGVESAVAAQAGGASRVELCQNLIEGGTTPSYGTIVRARESLEIGLHVMVRPRGGDFYYSATEFDVMKQDILTAKKIGADGVVLGVLNLNGTVDQPRNRELIDLARPMHVTFHRAFDMVRDPAEALESLIDLGVDSVLTSGGAPTALEGLEVLVELAKLAGDQIVIMPGAGLNAHNVKRILDETNTSEIHVGGSCAEMVESQMAFRRPTISVSRSGDSSEYLIRQTSAERVRAIVEIVSRRSADRST